MFNLSPIYSARKSSNHKLFKNRKISSVHVLRDIDKLNTYVGILSAPTAEYRVYNEKGYISFEQTSCFKFVPQTSHKMGFPQDCYSNKNIFTHELCTCVNVVVVAFLVRCSELCMCFIVVVFPVLFSELCMCFLMFLLLTFFFFFFFFLNCECVFNVLLVVVVPVLCPELCMCF